jgi:hypothetical protein
LRPLSLRAAALLGATLVAACSTTPAISNTNNIIRATDVELVCLEVDGARVTPHPAARCALSDTDNGPGAATNFHFHAVVPQFDRGELAVIDLATTTGVALVDNSPATPGYSFLPVGEFPVAITSDVTEGGGYLYVAGGRSDRVLRVEAAALRSDPRRAGFAARRVEVPVGGLPRDLVVVRAGGRSLLVATLPESRAVSIVDVTDAAAPGAPRVIALRGTPGDGDAGAAPAHPVALAVEEGSSRLYVTDDALRAVHVIDVAAGAELDLLPVGERTRAVAVTGLARARRFNCAGDPDHCDRTRYLYLTTADDGAVIVWDLARGARVRPNLLPLPNARGSRIDPGLATDRVALPAPATALVAINTGAYDPTAADVPVSPGDTAFCATGYVQPATRAFSGVFVGAVLRSGQLAIVDVDDYNVDAWEAQCQRGAGTTEGGVYRFVRHAPRGDATTSLAPKLRAAPATTSMLRGTTRSQTLEGASAPSLVCGPVRSREVPAECTEANGYGVSLPRRQVTNGSGAVAYGAPDPFTSRDESWAFVFEGVIPGLDQTGGALVADGGALVLSAPGGFFCTRGALAVEGRARDFVTVVSDPTPLAADAAECAALFGSGVAPLNRDFVVDRAFEDRLRLQVGAAVGDVGAVQRCYPQAIQYQVRAGGQWLALGNRSGYLHAVRAGAGRECEIDPAKQAEAVAFVRQCLVERGVAEPAIALSLPMVCPAGRACTGGVAGNQARAELAPVFANPFICTQIYPALQAAAGGSVVAVPVDRDTQITFDLINAWTPFQTSAGSLPVAARHLAGVDRLYVVDTAFNGLMELRLNPFQTGRIFN